MKVDLVTMETFMIVQEENQEKKQPAICNHPMLSTIIIVKVFSIAKPRCSIHSSPQFVSQMRFDPRFEYQAVIFRWYCFVFVKEGLRCAGE